jgi:hypothetical protein
LCIFSPFVRLCVLAKIVCAIERSSGEIIAFPINTQIHAGRGFSTTPATRASRPSQTAHKAHQSGVKTTHISGIYNKDLWRWRASANSREVAKWKKIQRVTPVRFGGRSYYILAAFFHSFVFLPPGHGGRKKNRYFKLGSGPHRFPMFSTTASPPPKN